MEILEAILKVASTEAGQRALLVLFSDHGVSQDKLDSIVRLLPTPQPPKH